MSRTPLGILDKILAILSHSFMINEQFLVVTCEQFGQFWKH